MKIDIRTIGDARILDVSGQITLGEGTMVIRNTVRDIMQSRCEKDHSQSCGCKLYRQLGSWRTGKYLYHRCQ